MLHAAGGRRYVVFDIVAGELLPLSNTLNGLLNQASSATMFQSVAWAVAQCASAG